MQPNSKKIKLHVLLKRTALLLACGLVTKLHIYHYNYPMFSLLVLLHSETIPHRFLRLLSDLYVQQSCLLRLQKFPHHSSDFHVPIKKRRYVLNHEIYAFQFLPLPVCARILLLPSMVSDNYHTHQQTKVLYLYTIYLPLLFLLHFVQFDTDK